MNIREKVDKKPIQVKQNISKHGNIYTLQITALIERRSFLY
jgi:hypothetical protein